MGVWLFANVQNQWIGGGKMSTKSELLKLLESHRGEYLSGEELASRLG